MGGWHSLLVPEKSIGSPVGRVTVLHAQSLPHIFDSVASLLLRKMAYSILLREGIEPDKPEVIVLQQTDTNSGNVASFPRTESRNERLPDKHDEPSRCASMSFSVIRVLQRWECLVSGLTRFLLLGAFLFASF